MPLGQGPWTQEGPRTVQEGQCGGWGAYPLQEPCLAPAPSPGQRAAAGDTDFCSADADAFIFLDLWPLLWFHY